MDGAGLVLNARIQKKQQRRARRLKTIKARFHDKGWRTRFIEDHVEAHVADDLDQQQETVVIESLAKSWVPEIVEDAELADIEADTALLYEAGFKRRTARKLAAVISPLYNKSYTRRQLIDIAIEFALGTYDKVLVGGQTYLFESIPEESWTPNALFKYVYNVPELDRLETVSSPCPGTQANSLFYHATNYRSASHIAQHGVAHLKGRPCLDFGIQPSFYMTPDLQTAIEWCRDNTSRWKGEACILVFSIPLEDSRKALNSKVFQQATSEWVDLVTSSRRCIENTNDLDMFDTVYGPMAANVRSIRKGRNACPHSTPKYQWASKSNLGDMYLRHCFAGAIFVKAAPARAVP